MWWWVALLAGVVVCMAAGNLGGCLVRLWLECARTQPPEIVHVPAVVYHDVKYPDF